ncbi:MAG: SDR family NAD(P)-dependent oxidoreductase [Candidatus Binataceae bacterium]
MNLGLAGKTALVTGGGRDIGREISLTLAREGAAVAINYFHSGAEAEKTAAEIADSGGRAQAFAADAADYGAVKAMHEEIAAAFGPVDILVNNAGYVAPNFFLKSTVEEWRRQIDVGLYSVLNCCHVMAPAMVERKFGRIINIAGDSARVGERRLSATAASRGGVLTLTKSLAKEFGAAGVTVNAIALGLVETSHSDAKFIAANRDRILQSYAIKRLGRPDDVAPIAAFLASAHASWITGQTVSVSGGYTTAG